ncbi:MAG TPA: hypothetical protein VN577_14080 [Terriglobales bacterium]|nr:hypothetical protein [Terriglobales bacterium]
MSLRDLIFRRKKDEVENTRVLVACCDSKFADLAKVDAAAYRGGFETTQDLTSNLPELFSKLQDCDILHLFCDVSSLGTIVDAQGNSVSGNELVERCLAANVKLLWIASENPANAYIQGFNLNNKPLNFVATLERRGQYFALFVENIVQRLKQGKTLPLAWVDLAPQTPQDPRHEQLPSCMFVAGRGSAIFK